MRGKRRDFMNSIILYGLTEAGYSVFEMTHHAKSPRARDLLSTPHPLHRGRHARLPPAKHTPSDTPTLADTEREKNAAFLQKLRLLKASQKAIAGQRKGNAKAS